MKSAKIFYIVIIILYAISNVFSQSTWEYYSRIDTGQNNWGYDEIILNVDEFDNKDIITTAYRYYGYYDQNSSVSVLRLHNGNTGEVYKENEYSIDTLTPSLEWIFYDKDSGVFTIVGSAHYIDVEKKIKRGYFLLTQWDKDLHLLKDTIFRLSPIDSNFFVWYFNGNYSSRGTYLLQVHATLNYEDPRYNNYETFMEIDKNGKILNKNSMRHTIHTSRHPSIIEDKYNDRYILIGDKTYYLNKNFEIIDSLYVLTGSYINTEHTTTRIYGKDTILIAARINDFHRGLAFLTTDIKYIKSIDLTTKEDQGTIELLLGRRSMDYINKSNIFLVSQDWKARYYTVSKVNSQLEPYWIKYISENDTIGNYVWSMKATSDGGCVVVGNKGELWKYNPYVLKQGAWMQKFDSDGNTVSTIEPKPDAWAITVYPNPSAGDFNIKIEGASHDAKLMIYDLQGRMVESVSGLNQGNNTMNFGNIPEGLYIWKLYNKDRELGSGKWVKR